MIFKGEKIGGVFLEGWEAIFCNPPSRYPSKDPAPTATTHEKQTLGKEDVDEGQPHTVTVLPNGSSNRNKGEAARASVLSLKSHTVSLTPRVDSLIMALRSNPPSLCIGLLGRTVPGVCLPTQGGGLCSGVPVHSRHPPWGGPQLGVLLPDKLPSKMAIFFAPWYLWRRGTATFLCSKRSRTTHSLRQSPSSMTDEIRWASPNHPRSCCTAKYFFLPTNRPGCLLQPYPLAGANFLKRKPGRRLCEWQRARIFGPTGSGCWQCCSPANTTQGHINVYS